MSYRWSSEEENFLSDYWGVWSFYRIVKELGRTTSAVRWKAWEMGLGGYMESMDGYTLRQLAEALGLHHGTVRRWIVGKGLPAVKRLCGPGQKVYCIRAADFWKWAEQNQSVVDLSNMEEFALGPEPDWVDGKRYNDRMKEKPIQQPWTMNEVEKVLKLQEQGLSIRQIAVKTGRTPASVKMRLQRERVRNESYKTV